MRKVQGCTGHAGWRKVHQPSRRHKRPVSRVAKLTPGIITIGRVEAGIPVTAHHEVFTAQIACPFPGRNFCAEARCKVRVIAWRVDAHEAEDLVVLAGESRMYEALRQLRLC